MENYVTLPEDFLPDAVHVGDVVDDALAHSKQFIPFLKAHIIPGRIQEERALNPWRIIFRGANATGHSEPYEQQYFQRIVLRELQAAGVID